MYTNLSTELAKIACEQFLEKIALRAEVKRGGFVGRHPASSSSISFNKSQASSYHAKAKEQLSSSDGHTQTAKNNADVYEGIAKEHDTKAKKKEEFAKKNEGKFQANNNAEYTNGKHETHGLDKLEYGGKSGRALRNAGVKSTISNEGRDIKSQSGSNSGYHRSKTASVQENLTNFIKRYN